MIAIEGIPKPMSELTPLRICQAIVAAAPTTPLRIYSIQSAAAIDSLQRTGTLKCTQEVLDRHSFLAGPSEGDANFRRAFGWMAEQLRMQTGGDGQTYPIWAWMKRPSLTGKERRYYQKQFMITAVVPRRRVLISDFLQWHACLHDGPVTISEQEFDHYDELRPDHDEESWRRLIQPTWRRVFEFVPEPGEQPHWRLRKRHVLQACIDELRSEEVLSIRAL